MNFFDFIGNQRAKNQIAAQIDNNRLHNTIIIEGEEGTEKERFADIIAMAAVCQGDDKPCGKCSGCIKAKAQSHPDILKFYPKDGRVKINSDEARDIKNKAFVMPNEAPRNVIIIGDAGNMEEKTQNMLLKVLEETPDRTTFILLCNSKERLIPTVISRGTLLTLGSVDINEAAEYALKKCPKASKEDALLCAEISNGLVGETVSLLQDKKLKENIELTARIVQNGTSGRYDIFMEDMLSLDKDKSRLKTVLKTTLIICRDALLISAGVNVVPINGVCEKLAVRLSQKQLQSIYDKTADIIKKSEQSANAKLLRVTYIMLLKNKGDE